MSVAPNSSSDHQRLNSEAVDQLFPSFRVIVWHLWRGMVQLLWAYISPQSNGCLAHSHCSILHLRWETPNNLDLSANRTPPSQLFLDQQLSADHCRDARTALLFTCILSPQSPNVLSTYCLIR